MMDQKNQDADTSTPFKIVVICIHSLIKLFISNTINVLLAGKFWVNHQPSLEEDDAVEEIESEVASGENGFSVDTLDLSTEDVEIPDDVFVL